MILFYKLLLIFLVVDAKTVYIWIIIGQGAEYTTFEKSL